MIDAKSILESLKIRKPTSSWDVFEHVIRLVTEEHKRLDMNYPMPVPDNVIVHEERPIPACGTVCCLGGWAAIVIGCEAFHGLWTVSQALVGEQLQYELHDSVFYNTRLYERGIAARPQTSEHVADAVKALREFMGRHEAFLRARIVTPTHI